jgi:hypothetical protein
MNDKFWREMAKTKRVLQSFKLPKGFASLDKIFPREFASFGKTLSPIGRNFHQPEPAARVEPPWSVSGDQNIPAEFQSLAQTQIRQAAIS